MWVEYLLYLSSKIYIIDLFMSFICLEIRKYISFLMIMFHFVYLDQIYLNMLIILFLVGELHIYILYIIIIGPDPV